MSSNPTGLINEIADLTAIRDTELLSGYAIPSNPTGLINEIADLTAIRDTELLEFSLLNTLQLNISPLQLGLHKIDNNGQLLSTTRYHNNQCEISTDDTELSEEYRAAFEYIKSSQSREFHTSLQDHHLSVFYLFKSRFFQIYLTITTKKSLTNINAHLIAGMLQIYRNFCGLLEDSQRDKLTGLQNRTTFERQIEKVYSLISSQDSDQQDQKGKQHNGFWLAMLDIDHFKTINDTFGHLYGDEVLVLLSQTMQSLLRENDLLFRYGGEEFVLITQCSDEESAKATFERLRKTIAEQQFPQLDQVTISIGAIKISPTVFPGTLLDYADQALYHSKKNGRNQISFFEDMQREGNAQVEEVESGSVELF